MNLSFRSTEAHLQLASNNGMTLSFSLELKPTSPAFGLTSGLNLRECRFELIIYPYSQSPYAEEHKADGRIGEFHNFMAAPTKKDNFCMLWVHLNDVLFNSLYFEVSRGNLPSDIDLGVTDDDESPDGLTEGVYPDATVGGPHLALRSFLFTMKLAGQPSTSTPK